MDVLTVERRSEQDGHDGDEVEGNRRTRGAHPPDQGGEPEEGERRAGRAQNGHGEQARPDELGARQARGRHRRHQHRGDQLGAPDDGEGVISRLQLGQQVEREPVEHRGQQHQAHAGRVGSSVHGRQAHRHHAQEAHHQADALEARGQLLDEEGGHQGGEQRRGRVDHSGQRRVDPLLGGGEEQERRRQPDQAQQRDARPVGPLHGLAGHPEQPEGRRAEGNAPEGDERRRQMLQAQVDQQERRPPGAHDAGQHEPVARGEADVARLLG